MVEVMIVPWVGIEHYCVGTIIYIRRCNLDVAPDNSPYITSQSPSEQKQMSLKENLKREFSRNNNFVHFFRTLNL